MVFIIIGIVLFVVMFALAVWVGDSRVYFMLVVAGWAMFSFALGAGGLTEKELAEHPESNHYTTKVVYEQQDSVYVAVDTVIIKKD